MASPCTLQDLQAAMGELRAEIPQLVATQTSAMRVNIEAALKELHDRSLVEVTTQVTQLKGLVEAQQATAVAEIGRITQDKFDKANEAFIAEQARLTASVDDLQKGIDKVGTGAQGEFERFSTLLAQHERNVEGHTTIVGDAVLNTLSKEVNGVRKDFFDWSLKVDVRLDAAEVVEVGVGVDDGDDGPLAEVLVGQGQLRRLVRQSAAHNEPGPVPVAKAPHAARVVVHLQRAP